MTELRHHLRLTADGKQVVGESGKAAQAVRGLDGAVARSGQTMDRAARQSAGLERRLGGVSAQANAVRAAVAGMVGAFGAREIVRADMLLTGIENSLRGVAGSAAGAGAELAYVRGEANRLGAELRTSANGYAQMQAAAKGTALAGQGVRDSWEAVTETLMIFNKSSADQERAIAAVVQMISKGKVQYEELKGQLAEHIPGAVRIAAKALGVLPSELEKMLEKGEVVTEDFLPKFAAALREEFGAGLAGAISSPRAELNRLRTDILEANAEFARAGFMDGLVDGVRSARAALADPELRDAANDLSALIGAGFRTAGEAAEFLAANADLVKAGLAGVIALNVGGWASAAGRALAENVAAWHAKHFGIVQATRAEALAAAAAVQTARAELAAANMERARLVSIGQKTAALELGLAAEAAYAGAVARSAAADAAAAAAMTAGAKAARAGSAAFAALGGPVGVAAIAVVGLAYAYNRWDDAMEPVLSAGEDEKRLLDDLNRLRGEAAVVTRENADELLAEAEAHAIAARAMQLSWLQAFSAMRQVVNERRRMIGDRWESGAPEASGLLGRTPVQIPQEWVDALGVAADPRLKRLGGGQFELPFEQFERAFERAGERYDEMAEGAQHLRDIEADIAARKAEWAEQDARAGAAELTTEQEKYQAMLDELALEREMAGWTDERREVELRARELLAAAQKAGRNLTLEEARAIVAETAAAVRAASALEDWDAAQEEFRRTTTMTAAEREVLAKTEEKLNLARAAGIALTAEQARAEAELEVYAEARKDYDDYLADLQEELRLAGMTAEQREVELTTMELLRRAQAAKIALTEQEARAMAAAYVQQKQALEQYQAFTIEMPQLARQAGEDIYRDLTDAFERVFRREGDVVKQFFADMRAIAFRIIAQIAAAMVFQPVFQPLVGGIGGAMGMGGGLAGALGAGAGGVKGLGAAGAAGSALGLAAMNPMGWINPGALGGTFAGFGKSLGLSKAGMGMMGNLGLGLGILGQGAMGAGVGGLAASLLGYDNTESKIGGGLGGMVGTLIGGPIGGLIGSVGGGLLGGFLGGKKHPFAESGVDLIGGRFAARGTRTDDGGPGEEVAAAAGKIADRMNALLPALESLGFDTRGAGAGASFGYDDGEYFGGGRTGLKDPEAAAEAVVSQMLDELIAQGGGDIRPDVKRLLQGGADPAEVARAFESLTQQTSAADAALAALENPARAAVTQMLAAQDARLAEVEALRRAGLAVDGLYETVQRLNQAELEKMVADPTRSFAAAIVAMEDPVRGQIDALMAAQDARRAEVLALREAGLAVDGLLMQLDRLDDLELDRALGEIGEAASAAAGELLRIRADLTGWADRMRTANDNSPYSIQQRRAEAEAQYRDMLARAKGGDQDSIRGITGAADTLLGLDRQATSSAAARLALYEEVLADIGALGAAETDADRIVAAINGLGGSLPPAMAANLFEALDTSGLGKIDYARFADFFGASNDRLDALQTILGPGFDVTNANLDDIFALIDFNGDGQISQMELINARLVASIQTEQKVVDAILALGGNIPPALAAELFRALDSSGLGKIDYVRFAQFFGASEDRLEAISAILGLGFDITAQQLGAVFGALDTNGDGTIDQLEFLNAQVAAQNAQLKAPAPASPPPASSGPTSAEIVAALNAGETWALQELLAARGDVLAGAQALLANPKGAKTLQGMGLPVSILGAAQAWWRLHGGGVAPFASGGVFEGGIYREPQLFNFNNGRTGVRFEAGDEFLAPAVRMPDGQMGVRAIGGGDARLLDSVRGLEREARATRDLVAVLVRVVADGNAATAEALMRNADLTADQKRLVEQQVNLARTGAARSAAA